MYLRDYILELQIQLMVLDLLWHVVRSFLSSCRFPRRPCRRSCRRPPSRLRPNEDDGRPTLGHRPSRTSSSPRPRASDACSGRSASRGGRGRHSVGRRPSRSADRLGGRRGRSTRSGCRRRGACWPSRLRRRDYQIPTTAGGRRRGP